MGSIEACTDRKKVRASLSWEENLVSPPLKVLIVRCFSLLLLVVPVGIRTQSIWISEAETIAEFLYLDGLLTERGRDELVFAVREDLLRMPTGYTQYATFEQDGSVTRAELLQYLSDVLKGEYLYRSGVSIYEEILGEMGVDPSSELDSLQDEEVQRETQRRRALLPGFITETRAEDKAADRSDTVRQIGSIGWVAFPPLGREIGGGQVPDHRSIYGYEVHETLRTLHLHRLITEEVYEAAANDLRENGLMPDFYLAEHLAEEMAAIETRGQRTADRAAAIRYLRDQSFIPAAVADSLLLDSVVLASTDKKDLYGHIVPGRVLSFDRPTELFGLTVQLREQMCAIDTLLCSLELEVIQQGEAEVIVSRRDGAVRDSIEYWYRFTDAPQDKQRVDDYLINDFFLPYNRLLDSLNADYRFYTIGLDRDSVRQPLRVLVLQLDSERSRALHTIELYRTQDRLHGPFAEDWLTSAEASELLDSLTVFGDLASLSLTEIEAGRNCIRSGTVRGLLGLYNCFPELTADFPPQDQWESISNREPFVGRPGDFYLVRSDDYDGPPARLVKLTQPAADYLATTFRQMLRRVFAD